MKIVYSREDQQIVALGDAREFIAAYECRNDYEGGFNEHGEPRASLPIGEYTCSAETPGELQGPAYGTFYIRTGDERGRDIHGGGSALPDPYAPRQGWRCTYGCLRMQNEDGEALSQLIIDAGNAVPLTVQEESVLAESPAQEEPAAEVAPEPEQPVEVAPEEVEKTEETPEGEPNA